MLAVLRRNIVLKYNQSGFHKLHQTQYTFYKNSLRQKTENDGTNAWPNFEPHIKK